jgi:hypothetical protein
LAFAQTSDAVASTRSTLCCTGSMLASSD